MDKPKAYYRLLLPSFLLLSACTVDISQPDSSATAVDAEAKTWAVKFQHQSSFTEQSIKEITAPDLKPGDLLFSSSLGVTSFGIRVFSTSSVSHVAIYLGDNNVAEATGAGVQIVSLKKAMKHSDKLFVYESRTLLRNKPQKSPRSPTKSKIAGITIAALSSSFPLW
jgi:uncharacterized protein YycO